jgi:prephenate dehydrogenase
MNTSTPKRLGLVGLGSFGQLSARHLRDHFEVVAADTADRSTVAAELGIVWGTPAEAAACSYVVLAVPVQSFATALESIRGHLRAGTLVVDVASVKLAPVREMERLLPADVEILGSHPLFGPQSAAAGLDGHRIVLCPVRTRRLEEVRGFLEQRLGLTVHVCDADTHDRDIAHTQALAQFVGRALAQLEQSGSPVRTPGYNRFREVADTVGEDSWELFSAIQNLNPYAAGMRAELLARLSDLQRRLAEDAPASAPGSPSRDDQKERLAENAQAAESAGGDRSEQD